MCHNISFHWSIVTVVTSLEVLPKTRPFKRPVADPQSIGSNGKSKRERRL